METDEIKHSGVTDEIKQGLIQKNRYINVDHDWWADVYEWFIEYLEKVGIETTRSRQGFDICFSGFHSQGDGACFGGRIDDWDLFFSAHPQVFRGDTFAYATSYKSDIIDAAYWGHNGSRYFHPHTLGFCIEVNSGYECEMDEEGHPVDLADAVKLSLQNVFDYVGFEDAIQDIVRGYCADLYTRLSEEYDYLTSDEVVWESVIASELYIEDNDE